MNVAKKMAKKSINSKPNNPPLPRDGDPKMLNRISCENTVDIINMAKRPKSDTRGKKTGLSFLGMAMDPSFL